MPEFLDPARDRIQLIPQLRDQRSQLSDLRRKLADQRITRILRRQRLGHGTRSSPKAGPAGDKTHSPQRNRDHANSYTTSHKTRANRGT